jgi:hypothetical protein
MRSYVVVFEFLDAPQEQYKYLQMELRSLHATRLTDTAYVINTEDTSAELTDKLIRHLRDTDRIFIYRVVAEDISDVV